MNVDVQSSSDEIKAKLTRLVDAVAANLAESDFDEIGHISNDDVRGIIAAYRIVVAEVGEVTALRQQVEQLRAEAEEAYGIGFEQVRRRCESAEAERDEWRAECSELRDVVGSDLRAERDRLAKRLGSIDDLVALAYMDEITLSPQRLRDVLHDRHDLDTVIAEFAVVSSLRAERDALRDELEELREATFPKSWAGFKDFIDEVYPDDIFPDDDRDLGPQFVVAARRLAGATSERDALQARLDAVQADRTREFREMMRLIAALAQERDGELRVKAFTLIALDDATVLERYDDHSTDEVVFRVRTAARGGQE